MVVDDIDHHAEIVADRMNERGDRAVALAHDRAVLTVHDDLCTYLGTITVLAVRGRCLMADQLDRRLGR